jgi:glycosyltransferase involved in cell wall biosynthesis
MSPDRIVVAMSVYDQADILTDFLEWYLDLGVDLILVQDCRSTDGSQDVLRRFAQRSPVRWFVLPERNMLKYDSTKVLSDRARDEGKADWIVYCDADEFLCAEGRDLRAILSDARRAQLTVLSVPRLNMTGRALRDGQPATQALTLRIDRPVSDAMGRYMAGDLSVPFSLTPVAPRTIVWAPALTAYGPGAHHATTAWGRSGEIGGLRFLHYPLRGFDTFQQKVRNTSAWLQDNPHLENWWGWHWRRWIRLEREGRLREEYEREFVSGARAREFIRDGVGVVDETVSRWRARRHPSGLFGLVRRPFR